MPNYTNGNIPYGLLVTFKRGWNQTDGDWDHSLSPATKARHDELVRLAKARTGRDLAISLGWSAYRPYAAQVLARKIHGIGAAEPGKSSHGGSWEGKQTLAMDYGNWAWVYEGKGGRDAFWADCRAAGLTPGMIMKSRGYPDEPWHVIDLNPWSAVPSFGGSPASNNSKPVTPAEFSATDQFGDEMFIAHMPNGSFLIIPMSEGKYRAVVLDGNAIVNAPSVPQFRFTSAGSQNMLAQVVIWG